MGLVTNNGVRPITNIYHSTDGGTTLNPRGSGLDGASVFSIALNPADSAHLVVGTVGEGIFVSRDSGDSWIRGSGDLRASAILSFSEDPNDENHLVASSTESLNGTHGVYETTNGGTTWSLVDFQTDARVVEITPGGSLLLARFNAGGVARRAPAGSWQETLAGESVEEFEYDRADRIWAIGSGLHMSDDDGDSWDERIGGTFFAMAQHPDQRRRTGRLWHRVSRLHGRLRYTGNRDWAAGQRPDYELRICRRKHAPRWDFIGRPIRERQL